jgi:hypothetical protein
MIVATNDQYYSDIADAIRTKLGGTAKYFPAGMAAEVGNITSPTDIEYVDTAVNTFNTTGTNSVQVYCPQLSAYAYYLSVCYVVNISTGEQVGFGITMYGKNGQPIDSYKANVNMSIFGTGPNQRFSFRYDITDSSTYLYVISAYRLK